jgi:endonuclease/exonuclease/phosphatase (EEP) superfamily protein YafD
MLIRFRNIASMLVLSLLTSCVSIDSKLHLVTNALAASDETQACDVKPVLHPPIDGLTGLDPENIAFLNWNIYKGNGEDWQKDLTGFAENHDVMTIQEATLDDEFITLLESHDHSWIMNTAFHFNGTSAGVMNVANANAVHSCGFKDQEPLIRIPKSTLVSYYQINGSDKRLLVANIHGINFTFGVSSYHQQLENLYEAVEHHDGPMIVAGDFNSWSDDRMAEVERLVARLSLSKITYPVNNKTHIFGNAIDHVFYRQLEIVNNQVWQVSSSDHNPISVNFRLRSAELYSALNSATKRK